MNILIVIKSIHRLCKIQRANIFVRRLKNLISIQKELKIKGEVVSFLLYLHLPSSLNIVSLLCVSKVNNSSARFPLPPLSRTLLQLYHFPLDLCLRNFTDFPPFCCVPFIVSRSMASSCHSLSLITCPRLFCYPL